jgi:hypothetical protein
MNMANMKTIIALIVILLAVGCATSRMKRDFLTSAARGEVSDMCAITYRTLTRDPDLVVSLIPEAVSLGLPTDTRWVIWGGILQGAYHYTPQHDPQFKTNAVRTIFRMGCEDESAEVRECAFSLLSVVLPEEDAHDFLATMMVHTNSAVREAASNCLEQILARKNEIILPNGWHIRWQVNYKDGKPYMRSMHRPTATGRERLETSWYYNGQKKTESLSVESEDHTDVSGISWYDNGQKEEETGNSTYSRWYRSGQIEQQEDYLPNKSLRRQWDHDGRLIAEGFYRNKREWAGIFVKGSNEHGVRMIETYVHGKLVATKPDSKYANYRAVSFPFADGSDEAPLAAVSAVGSWLPDTAATVLVAVWPSGRVVWSQDRREGGDPYFEGFISTNRVDVLIRRFEANGYLSDKELEKGGTYVIDGSYDVIYVKSEIGRAHV